MDERCDRDRDRDRDYRHRHAHDRAHARLHNCRQHHERARGGGLPCLHCRANAHASVRASDHACTLVPQYLYGDRSSRARVRGHVHVSVHVSVHVNVRLHPRLRADACHSCRQ